MSQLGIFLAAIVLALPACVTRDAGAQERKKDVLLTTSIPTPDGCRIFRMNTDGSGRKLLTAGKKGIVEADPALSPDGQRIAFVGNMEGEKDFGLYVMNADGSGRKRLAAKANEELDIPLAPSWSPDNKRIAFCTVNPGSKMTNFNHFTRLYLVDADGKNLKRLEKVAGLMPVWAPDGQRLLFTCATGLCAVDADGTNVRPLVKIKAITMGAWSPDGKSLAYVVPIVGNVRGEAAGLFVARADGSEPKRLTADAYGVQWSADGKRLFFTRENAVYAVDSDGQNLSRVTDAKEPECLGGIFIFVAGLRR